MKRAISSISQSIASLLRRMLSFLSGLGRRLRLLFRREKAQGPIQREPAFETKAEAPSRLGKLVSVFRRPVSFLTMIVSFFGKLFSFLRKVLSFLGRLLSPLRKLLSPLGKAGRKLWLVLPGRRLLAAAFRERPVSKRERYYYIRYATSVLRIIAWAVLVIGFIVSLVWGIGRGGAEGGLQIALGMVGSFLVWLALLAVSEFLKLLMDVKKNTEDTAEGAFSIVKRR